MDAEQSDTPPTNPEIVVKSPAIASVDDVINIGGSDVEVDNGDWEVFFEDEAVRYSAEAFAVGGNAVTKMELYDGNTLIESFDGSSIDTDIYLSEGTHYLTCRAYNARGEETQSVTSIVYVKSTDAPGSYSHVQIGSTGYDGLGGRGDGRDRRILHIRFGPDHGKRLRLLRFYVQTGRRGF